MAQTAAAAETIYECTADYNTRDGVILPQIVFFVDEAKGTARVLDGRIQSLVGAPLDGELEKRSAKVHRIEWEIKDTPTNIGKIDVAYRANLNHATNSYTMDATVGGYDNEPRGQGRCKVLR